MTSLNGAVVLFPKNAAAGQIPIADGMGGYAWSTLISGGVPISKPVIVATGVLASDLGGLMPAVANPGITGATAASRYVGATNGGPPVSGGPFAVGDYAIDRTGPIWICTSITAGQPGTWSMSGAGVQLAYADLSTDPAAISSTEADIAGLSITFAAPARFEVQAYIPVCQFAAAANNPSFHISDGSNTVVAYGFSVGGNASGFNNIFTSPIELKVTLPTTGTGAYAITPGTMVTFKLRGFTGSGTANIKTNSGTSRPRIRAVSC